MICDPTPSTGRQPGLRSCPVPPDAPQARNNHALCPAKSYENEIEEILV